MTETNTEAAASGSFAVTGDPVRSGGFAAVAGSDGTGTGAIAARSIGPPLPSMQVQASVNVLASDGATTLFTLIGERERDLISVVVDEETLMVRYEGSGRTTRVAPF